MTESLISLDSLDISTVIGRRFILNRVEDESGVSGTGVVAVGIQFPGGQCVMFWLTDHNSIGIYPNIVELEAIHGHNGKTKVLWWDRPYSAEEGVSI